jgi:hypothetical protein
MRVVAVVVFLVISTLELGQARIGDTIGELKERYGTASHLHDEVGGLTVVEYNKPPYLMLFKLLDLKTEGVEIRGVANDAEVEVLLARNVPAGTTFQLTDNPRTPYSGEFSDFKDYTFSNDVKAYSYRLKGAELYGIIIRSPKMQAFEEWTKEQKKKKKITEANEKIDAIESPSLEAVPRPKERDPSAPPPDIFRDLSAVSGGAVLGQDASFASMGTALGRYQHKLYLAIGSRWNVKVSQMKAKMPTIDRVVVRFQVNADGTVSDIDIVQGDPNSILGTISADSIKQSSDLIGPFPADLKAENPRGFPWQLAFRVYKSGN